MSKPLELVSNLHRVGRKFSVRFRMKLDPQAGMFACNCVWYPYLPKPAVLRKRLDVAKYNAARTQFITDVEQRTGLKILCLDLGRGEVAT